MSPARHHTSWSRRIGISRRGLLTGLAGSGAAAIARPRAARADCPWYNPACLVEDTVDVVEEAIDDTVDVVGDVDFDDVLDVAEGLAGGYLIDGARLAYEGTVYTVEAVGDGAEYVFHGPGDGWGRTGAALYYLGFPLADPLVDMVPDEIRDLIPRYRAMSSREATAAREVFGTTLPPRGEVVLTNLPGIGGRQWVWINPVTGDYLVNLGRKYADPLGRSNVAIFMHELTHVWQIYHRNFVSWACAVLTNRTYHYDVGRDWSDIHEEAQGNIVQDWVAGCHLGSGSSVDCDGLFPYIDVNIRQGDPWAPYPGRVQRPDPENAPPPDANLPQPVPDGFIAFDAVRVFHTVGGAIERRGPTREAGIVRQHAAGDVLRCDGYVRGQFVLGDDRWLRTVASPPTWVHTSGLVEFV